MINNEFANLKEQYDRVGNVTAEQKEQKETEELVDSIIKDKNPFQNVEINDIWIDDDLFDNNDLQAIVETSKQIIDEITPNPLIELNIATLPDTEDKMDDDDIDFTIADSQLVEGNNTQLNRDTKPFVDFTVTYSRVVDSDSDNNIDFTITDSQLVEGNGTGVNRENQLFVDFTITDSRVVGNSNNDNDSEIDFTITSLELVEGNDPTVNRETEPFIDFTITDSRAIDSKDGIETIKVTMHDNICIPNTNMIGRDTGLPKGKKIITSHLTLAVWPAEKIKKKYRQKRIGKKVARISTDGSRFKEENKEAAEWLKDKGFLDDNVSVEKADVGETIDLKKTSGASIAVKNIVKKYRNLAREKTLRKEAS